MFCGIPTMAAVSIYSVEGFAGLGGRLLFGVAADRLGVKRVIVAGLLVQALAIPAYLAVRGIGDFYLLATIFGMAYGGVMPLYAVLAREYFGQSIMGTVLGGGDDALLDRHGARPGRRRLDLRHLRQLRLALHRLGPARLRRRRHRARLPAAPGRAARCRPGLIDLG